MHLQLSEEQSLIQKSAHDFAERELWSRAAERDARKTFPEGELLSLGALGLLGINVPEAYGGSEAGAVAYSLAMQEIAWGDPSVAVAVSVTNMVGELICAFGSEEQKKRHVPRLCSGEAVCGAFGLSEAQAGSDPAALSCRAERTASGYRLTGTKQWITGGDRAGVIVVWAVTEPEAGHDGISAFLVSTGAPGLSVARLEDKMGLRGSTTAQLVLDGVEVAETDRLGAEGLGFKIAMSALDGGRIGISSQAIGTARRAFEVATAYSLERQTFGVPIAEHQAIGNMLADMATWLDAARLMTLRAAWRKQQGQPYTREASMAKLFATEHAVRICDQALQIHGGYGYTRDYPVERLYRDVRVTKIYEGTSEIQRIVIARQLIKDVSE